MLDSTQIGFIVGSAIVIPTYSFATYWAFNITRALPVPLYRRRAASATIIALILTISAVSQPVILFGYGLPFSAIFSNPIILSLGILFYFFIFYFVDTTIGAARHEDPLSRDVLGWRTVRFSLLVLMGIGAMGLVMESTAFSPSASIDFFLSLATFLPWTLLVPDLAGAIYIAGAALRSRDSPLRNHMKWLALFLVFDLVFVVLVPMFLSDFTVILAAALVGNVGEALILLQSVRLLAPINKIELI